MKRKKLSSILFVLLVLSFVSCDYEHVKDYYIENKCANEILVRFSVGRELDSMQIQAGATELIYSHRYIFGTVGVSDERYKDLVGNLSVENGVEIRPLHESRWSYKELGKYHAVYSLSVDDALFQP